MLTSRDLAYLVLQLLLGERLSRDEGHRLAREVLRLRRALADRSASPGDARVPDVSLTEPPSPAERLEALRADIADRLRPACPQMPDDEFAALVERIAERTLKWELDGVPWHPLTH
jgi:hypothetical protein